MYYTTEELARELKYKNRASFLKALHENCKLERGDKKLTSIWNCREKVGKKWLFKKDQVDLILGGE